MFGLGKLASVLLGRANVKAPPGFSHLLPALSSRIPRTPNPVGTPGGPGAAASPEVNFDAAAGAGAPEPPPYIPQAPAPPMQMGGDMGQAPPPMDNGQAGGAGLAGVGGQMTPGWLPQPGAGAGMKMNHESPVPQPGEAPAPMPGMNRGKPIFRM